jgi:hypothetical protein
MRKGRSRSESGGVGGIRCTVSVHVVRDLAGDERIKLHQKLASKIFY